MSDTEDQPAPPPSTHNRGRRTSVSAESMMPSHDDKYEKVVIAKTDEQKARIQKSVQSNFLFRNLDEEQYRDVVDAMMEKRTASDEVVIQQGGVGDYFYVVEAGAFDVFVAKAGAQPVKVTSYGPGGSFGELALMYNAPRAATIVSTADGVLWALDRVTFRRILLESTSRKRRLYESLLEEVPLLKSLEPYERHKIADALETATFRDKDVIIKQGDDGDVFYIIESGEVNITKTDDAGQVQNCPGLKKGDYFGELALLSNKPRAATVTASGKVKCATLKKDAFDRLLGPVLDIMKRNSANYTALTRRKSIQAILEQTTATCH